MSAFAHAFTTKSLYETLTSSACCSSSRRATAASMSISTVTKKCGAVYRLSDRRFAITRRMLDSGRVVPGLTEGTGIFGRAGAAAAAAGATPGAAAAAAGAAGAGR